jgi:hypothetical protein
LGNISICGHPASSTSVFKTARAFQAGTGDANRRYETLGLDRSTPKGFYVAAGHHECRGPGLPAVIDIGHHPPAGPVEEERMAPDATSPAK